MSQVRLSMRKIKEVLRLSYDRGLSQRKVAHSVKISHTAVQDYLYRFKESGLTWPLPEEMDDGKLERLLFRTEEKVRCGGKSLPDLGEVYGEMKKKGVTLQLLWEEYRASHPEGYSYSRFCDCYRQWKKSKSPVMRQQHKGGEKLFLDYAGQRIPVVNPETGETWYAEIFVAVLGASNYTYAEAHRSQDLPNWISGHVRALNHIGGVPELLVPDNLKSAVTSPCRYEPDINPTYHDLAVHYGTTVLPARVRKPRDKAKVEVGVLVVERWILARLRKMTFFSLQELNEAIKGLLTDLNNRPMRHLNMSRRELFEMVDKPLLRPLPERSYELSFWKNAKVGIDYHVMFQNNYYSVPYTLIHQIAQIRVTEKIVEVYHKSKRVASHPRSYESYRFMTSRQHMPKNHQAMLEWTPERLLIWGKNIGTGTTEMIRLLMVSRRHPEQAYRSCLGLLKLSSRFSEERLELACIRALAHGVQSYKGVKNILISGFDQIPMEEAQPDRKNAPHSNIRGTEYYN